MEHCSDGVPKRYHPAGPARNEPQAQAVSGNAASKGRRRTDAERKASEERINVANKARAQLDAAFTEVDRFYRAANRSS